jgi:hypothetical protein
MGLVEVTRARTLSFRGRLAPVTNCKLSVECLSGRFVAVCEMKKTSHFAHFAR